MVINKPENSQLMIYKVHKRHIFVTFFDLFKTIFKEHYVLNNTLGIKELGNNCHTVACTIVE